MKPSFLHDLFSYKTEYSLNNIAVNARATSYSNESVIKINRAVAKAIAVDSGNNFYAGGNGYDLINSRSSYYWRLRKFINL